MAYERKYDVGEIVAQLGMIKILSPKLVDLLYDLMDESGPDRPLEGDSSNLLRCPCGSITHDYLGPRPRHVCSLTAMREVLSAFSSSQEV